MNKKLQINLKSSCMYACECANYIISTCIQYKLPYHGIFIPDVVSDIFNECDQLLSLNVSVFAQPLTRTDR